MNEAAESALNPTRKVFGDGTFEHLPSIVESYAPRSILLVLGERSFRSSRHYQELREWLGPYQVIESAAITQNPQQAFIQDEINRLQPINYDLVIAIGGGSVIDVSKLLASIPRQKERQLERYIQPGFTFDPLPVPVIAIPTTSGTGSEVTPYVSLETLAKKKISLSHALFYPAVALIDPVLTHTMPEYVTASTGFDALSQAIESYWAVAATPNSRIHALKAVDLIFDHLALAVSNPKHSDARAAMSLASCEAGIAIAQTRTTAVHSVSYPITAHFGVAHGHACALTLAPFIQFNHGAFSDPAALLKAGKTNSFDELSAKVNGLMQKTKLETSLSKLGIDEKGQEIIIQDGFRPDRVLNNPRKLTVDDLRKILKEIA